MVDIAQKRIDLDEQKRRMTGLQYAARASLKLREWDILTRVCCFLNETGETTPRYALESERPDFATFWDNETEAYHVEITEVLHPDYRRGDFWRENEKLATPKHYTPDAELSDPWISLRSCLKSKSGKSYPPNTNLWIYHNISRFSFPDWDIPFDQQLLDEHSKIPFEYLDSFSRVLVLWADMKSLTELHPFPRPTKADTSI